MTKATEKPHEVRMENLLLASALAEFMSSFKIVRTVAQLEGRKWEVRKWRQGENGSSECF